LISTIEFQQVTPPSSTHRRTPDSVIPHSFAESERIIERLLRKYLADAVRKIDATSAGSAIARFVSMVDWSKDMVITFNYDLLLEKFLSRARINAGDRMIHMHGSLNDKTLVYPNFKKFNSRKKRI
jgi:hypothetical protein